MVDAILIDDNTSPFTGTGKSLLARTVGYATNNNIIAKWENNHWYELNSNEKLFTDTFFNFIKHQHLQLSTMGIYYDNCEGGNQKYNDFEQNFRDAYNTTYLNGADTYCKAKGMRLPITTEASRWNNNGVPNCSSWTWTKKISSSGDPSSIYRSWKGISGTDDGSFIAHHTDIYTRCVTE